MWDGGTTPNLGRHWFPAGPPAAEPIPDPARERRIGQGWSADGKPLAADGTRVAAFARSLDHPRWLYVLPNGDVLVAETNAPPRPENNKGIRGWFFNHFQKKAGGAVPSANRIILLRDADGDGVAETRSVFLSGLNAPFGMALVGKDLTVGDKEEKKAFPQTDQFAPELLHFSDCVLSGRDLEPSGLEGLSDVRVIEALYRSATSGVPVPLSGVPPGLRPSLQQLLERPAVEEPELIKVTPPSGK